VLVLSRRIGESIMIGDDIEVKILKIDNSTVKIGIVAPSNVKIYRQEIYKIVADQNKKIVNEISSNLNEITYFKEVFKDVNKD
jgi:carbon storage regulator